MAKSWPRPRKLEQSDEVESFSCGNAELDDWFHRFAFTDQRAGMSTVFVSESEGHIDGFYALATAGIDPSHAPARAKQGVAGYPIPAILLTRMGVDMQQQGLGLGSALLRDVCFRVAAVSEEVGVRALLIHAKDEGARRFYLSFAEFEESPTDPLHLVLLIKDLRKAILS